MPMNVADAITPAMTHTSRLLFKPFALRKWLALGLVSFLAGSGGGGGAHANWPSGQQPGHDADVFFQHIAKWASIHAWLIALAIAGLLAISLFFGWLGSVFRFVYLNQITKEPIAIREPFHRFLDLGTSFFLWRLAFSFVALVALGVLIGLPLIAGFSTHAGSAAEALAVAWAVCVGIALLLCIVLIEIFARDFVLATMFVRGIRVMEAWGVVLPLLKANAGQCALYILLLIVISVVVGIGAAIAVLAVGLAFVIPGGLLALIGWAIWLGTGQHMSAPIIAYSVIIGIPLMFAFAYVLTCAIQPLQVFRRSFALVVLGQADPSLVTVPIPPTDGPRLMPEDGV